MHTDKVCDQYGHSAQVYVINVMYCNLQSPCETLLISNLFKNRSEREEVFLD